MYKINLAAMLLLSAGVAGGAAYLALYKDSPDTSRQERIEYLVRSLGDSNPNVRRQAEKELKQIGPMAEDALKTAAQSGDREIADRAQKLLGEIRSGASTLGEASPEILSPGHGVAIELSVREESADRPRFYVRMTNYDSIPYLVARDRVGGRISYGRFARFEVVDAQGQVTTATTEERANGSEGKIEFIVLGAGETLDLYAGQADSMTSLPVRLAPGQYQVRFVYHAIPGSPYRHVVQGASQGAPLPPVLLASAAVSIRILS